MSQAGWNALRRVEREGSAGSVLHRQNLMRRGLIEWVPGESGVRLTPAGIRALQERARG